MAMNHRRYMAWSLSSTRVVFETPRNGTQAVPYGFAGGWYRLTAQVVFAACHGDESSPLHCVVPFIHTGYIGDAHGTAHRPFPTVALMGGTVHPHRFYSERSGRLVADK